jgi:hypothetical protein
LCAPSPRHLPSIRAFDCPGFYLSEHFFWLGYNVDYLLT